MKSKIIALFLAVGLLGMGCQLDQVFNDRVEIGITQDIVLQMKQSLSPAGPGLNFIFQSTRDYSCDDAGFEYKTNTTSGHVNIQLMNLDIPNPCNGGNAPATEYISMPSLAGSYSLSIALGDLIQNHGTLIIDQKGYRLYMDTQDGISIPNTTMHRIPQGTIWGYVYHGQSPFLAINKFQSLIAPYAGASHLDEGNYGHFYASAPEQVTFTLPAERSTASFFVLHFNGSASNLNSIINETRDQLPADTELRVYSWNGGIF